MMIKHLRNKFGIHFVSRNPFLAKNVFFLKKNMYVAQYPEYNPIVPDGVTFSKKIIKNDYIGYKRRFSRGATEREWCQKGPFEGPFFCDYL